MKKLSYGASTLALVCLEGISSALAQGTFQNLDFEGATVPDVPAGQDGGFVSSTDGLPAWTVYYGPFQGAQIRNNNFTLGDVNVSILGPNWGNAFGISILGGKYSAILQAGSPQHDTAAIAQTGTIPASARSIQMRVNPFGGLIPAVTFAGHDVPIITLVQNSFSDLLMGADISAFAGQTGELRFTALSLPGFYFGSFEIDSIVFSDTAIPEPCATSLLVLGACLFGLRLWWQRRCNITYYMQTTTITIRLPLAEKQRAQLLAGQRNLSAWARRLILRELQPTTGADLEGSFRRAQENRLARRRSSGGRNHPQAEMTAFG